MVFVLIRQNMSRDFAYRVPVLILLAVLLLFSSCKSVPDTADYDSERVNIFQSGASYGGQVVELGLAEDEKALDLLEEEDGYRLLVGKQISDETPFPQEDGTTIFFRSGTILQTEYRFLNTDFSPSGKEAVPTEDFRISDQKVDGVLYEFCGEPYIEKPSGDDDGTRHVEFLDGTLYADGKELWSVSTSWDENFFLTHGPTTVASDGKSVYQDLFYHQRIYADGKRIPLAENIPVGYGAESKTPRGICGIMRLGDTVYALVYDTGDQSILVPLSPDMEKIEKKGTPLNVGATGPCDSDGETGFFFSGTVLYATDGKDCRKLADLARHGFTAGTVIRRILPLADGRILILSSECLVVLSPGEEEEEIPVITLGTIKAYGNDDLEQKVVRYNAQSDEYVIAIKNFDTPEDLNKALLSGEVGLLASNDRLLLRNYAEKGLLLDLEEGMPGLFKDGVLYKSLVDAARVDGKSYFLPRTFWFYGYKIKESLYPESGFRTMEDFFGFIDEKNPEHKKRIERSIVFNFYGLRRLDEWIDWDAGTCRFDDGDFERVLTFCGSCSTREEADAYVNAHSDEPVKIDQMTFMSGVASSGDIDENGNRYAYFWLPSRVHQGPEVYTPYLMGIVKNEKYEEAAKDFMDFVFLTDLAEGAKDDEGITRLIKGGKSAEWIEGYSINVKENGAILDSYGCKSGSEERKLTEEWLGKADQIVYIASELHEVLTDEANRYFAGEITAKQAAEYVQNRVSIYLAEQG